MIKQRNVTVTGHSPGKNLGWLMVKEEEVGGRVGGEESKRWVDWEDMIKCFCLVVVVVVVVPLLPLLLGEGKRRGFTSREKREASGQKEVPKRFPLGAWHHTMKLRTVLSFSSLFRASSHFKFRKFCSTFLGKFA